MRRKGCTSKVCSILWACTAKRELKASNRYSSNWICTEKKMNSYKCRWMKWPKVSCLLNKFATAIRLGSSMHSTRRNLWNVHTWRYGHRWLGFIRARLKMIIFSSTRWRKSVKTTKLTSMKSLNSSWTKIENRLKQCLFRIEESRCWMIWTTCMMGNKSNLQREFRWLKTWNICRS